MRFTWDPAKSERNLAERGFDFALGIADEIPLTVAFTDRAEAGEVVRRVISARVSNRRERQAYRKVFPSQGS